MKKKKKKSVFVQRQTVEGFRVGQSHLGAHGLGPYMTTLTHCSFGILFEGYILSEASFHAQMFPSVMFPSLVVLSYKSTENLSVTATLSASIASLLTDSSLNDSVIFRYILKQSMQYLLRCPANADTASHHVNE